MPITKRKEERARECLFLKGLEQMTSGSQNKSFRHGEEDVNSQEDVTNQATVFLSSTYIDLVDYRKAAKEALERLVTPIGWIRVFEARPEEAQQASPDDLQNIGLFVGIYAHRYGYVPSGSTVSITEQEYDKAKQLKKPMFCFIIDHNFPWPPTMFEHEANPRLLPSRQRSEPSW